VIQIVDLFLFTLESHDNRYFGWLIVISIWFAETFLCTKTAKATKTNCYKTSGSNYYCTHRRLTLVISFKQSSVLTWSVHTSKFRRRNVMPGEETARLTNQLTLLNKNKYKTKQMAIKVHPTKKQRPKVHCRQLHITIGERRISYSQKQQ